MSSEKKFVHDCDKCTFLGHFYGNDVYICKDSIIARDGNEPWEYGSTMLSMLRNFIGDNENIGTSEGVMKAQDFIFSAKCPKYYRAWIVALMLKGIDK